MTSRSYCFTTFDTDIDFEEAYGKGGIRYLVYSIECCPETGRNHIQGYVELLSPKRVTGVKKLFGDDTMHLETRRGTRDQARDYCMKEETRVDGPFEFGDFGRGGQGSRNDLQDVVDCIDEKGLAHAIDEYPVEYIKYHKGMEKYALHKSFKRTWEMIVYYIYGEPGTGKTRWVYENFDPDEIYEKPHGKWWDGYKGQRVVLLDDFDGSWFMWSDFMKLLDRYPYKCEVKGAYLEFQSEVIVITTNVPYEDWYPNKYKCLGALERRITAEVDVVTQTIEPFN